MSVSYSAITNYGKFVMGSVDSWGTDMNILKDPPRSIMTRRIDKVGQTSEITEAIDQSENRNAECIRVYQRGSNPFTSVSFQNYGSTHQYQQPQGQGQVLASMPYKVSGDAFRPPVASQYDLLPQSRLPRVWTSAFTQPGFVDFSKKMESCGNPEIKYKIQPSRTINYRTVEKAFSDQTKQEVMTPHKFSDKEMLRVSAQTNPTTALSNGILIDDFELPSYKTKDVLQGEYNTNKTGLNKVEFIHDEISLQRVLPQATAETNLKRNEQKILQHEYMRPLEQNRPNADMMANKTGMGETNIGSREAYLLQKPNAGSFDGRGTKPSNERIGNYKENFESDKVKMSRKVYEQFRGKYEN